MAVKCKQAREEQSQPNTEELPHKQAYALWQHKVRQAEVVAKRLAKLNERVVFPQGELGRLVAEREQLAKTVHDSLAQEQSPQEVLLPTSSQACFPGAADLDLEADDKTFDDYAKAEYTQAAQHLQNNMQDIGDKWSLVKYKSKKKRRVAQEGDAQEEMWCQASISVRQGSSGRAHKGCQDCERGVSRSGEML